MRTLKFFVFAVILILACGTAVADPINVYFSPLDSYQAVGSNFTISVQADIPDNPGLVAYSFNLLWNDSMMRLNNVNGTGSPWDVLWDAGTPQSITGLLFPTPTSPISEAGAGVLLANLDFTCLQEGSSGLSIGMDSSLAEVGLQGFYGPNGEWLDYTVTDGEVDQGVVVSEPSSILLLPAGILGLGIWIRRRR